MSLESVKAFYQRLAQDQEFRTQLEGLETSEESSQLLQQAGYNFTQEEFENYTAELLESNLDEGDLKDLNEKELEAVFGGMSPFPPIQALYGVIIIEPSFPGPIPFPGPFPFPGQSKANPPN
ncbi:Nif11-like leader peptide family natural product precursor [Crocosphaera sp.]|uniref:Nif11-like leader peptide family natural product precursor n=1 Tax=Crocosphaera sp. TaxID=2729996 RepID=UPI003F1E5E96|nr:Nif11-like leader peptide family natural product precursor [Crocosphaera sp.]